MVDTNGSSRHITNQLLTFWHTVVHLQRRDLEHTTMWVANENNLCTLLETRCVYLCLLDLAKGQKNLHTLSRKRSSLKMNSCSIRIVSEFLKQLAFHNRVGQRLDVFKLVFPTLIGHVKLLLNQGTML